MLSVADILKWPKAPTDHTIFYGPQAEQFAELRLPSTGSPPYPIVIVIHGGFWRKEYGDMVHITPLSQAITNELGVATWTIEYRRVGHEGGGWPGTFLDVAKATDYLRKIAVSYQLDLKRVVALGHSAGGHLAAWLAIRDQLPLSSLLYAKKALTLSAVISLAGIPNLRQAFANPVSKESVTKLLLGEPSQVPLHYTQGSPINYLPTQNKIPIYVLHGRLDSIVPPQTSFDFYTKLQETKNPGKLILIEDSGHFELIRPSGGSWSSLCGLLSASSALPLYDKRNSFFKKSNLSDCKITKEGIQVMNVLE